MDPPDRPLTLAQAHGRAAARLREAGVDAPETDAAWLLEAATGLTPAEQVLERGRELASEEEARLQGWLRRREAREPLQLILGETVFFGHRLQLREGVLIPRPETERLVELVLAEAPAPGSRWHLFDIGTGCGAIALAIKGARREATVTASDADPAAVRLASANALALGLDVTVLKSDLLAAPEAAAAASSADVVVANLPYLPRGDRADAAAELRWEPEQALYAGEDGLSVARRLLAEAALVMGSEALLWLELDPRTVDALAAEARARGWRDGRVEADLSGRRRFLRLRPPALAPSNPP